MATVVVDSCCPALGRRLDFFWDGHARVLTFSLAQHGGDCTDAWLVDNPARQLD